MDVQLYHCCCCLNSQLWYTRIWSSNITCTWIHCSQWNRISIQLLSVLYLLFESKSRLPWHPWDQPRSSKSCNPPKDWCWPKLYCRHWSRSKAKMVPGWTHQELYCCLWTSSHLDLFNGPLQIFDASLLCSSRQWSAWPCCIVEWWEQRFLPSSCWNISHEDHLPRFCKKDRAKRND